MLQRTTRLSHLRAVLAPRGPHPAAAAGRATPAAQRAVCTASGGAPAALPSPIAVIGAGGKMASALINGLQAHPSAPRILAANPVPGTLTGLALPDSQKLDDNVEAALAADVVLLCVKPGVAPTVLAELQGPLRDTRADNPPAVVSVVAGLTTPDLRAALAGAAPVARAMPNVAAAVRGSCTAVAAESDDDALARAEAVLSGVGTVARVPESLFAPATALAGSGVAYLFMAAEALADAGVRHGLPRPEAIRMAAAVVHGAGALLNEGGHPAVLRNDVESPGGITIAATARLEDAGFRTALAEAVDAAVERSVEMEDEAK